MELNKLYADRFAGDGLTFDDVLLVPAQSDVLPADVSLKTTIAKGVQLNTDRKSVV